MLIKQRRFNSECKSIKEHLTFILFAENTRQVTDKYIYNKNKGIRKKTAIDQSVAIDFICNSQKGARGRNKSFCVHVSLYMNIFDCIKLMHKQLFD